jgi:tRNA A37 methylthiotransferase MiaB
MKRAAFYTLGCKVNHYDTEAMIDQFKEAGYEIVDFSQSADVYIINTCTVTTGSPQVAEDNPTSSPQESRKFSGSSRLLSAGGS